MQEPIDTSCIFMLNTFMNDRSLILTSKVLRQLIRHLVLHAIMQEIRVSVLSEQQRWIV
jgi:hypothetical protein